MVDGLKNRPLVFDRGIDQISYRLDGITGEEFSSAERILPSEDGIRPQLDDVIHAPSVKDYINQYLTPVVDTRELLRPSVYGTAIGEIRQQLSDTVMTEPAGASALERLSQLLTEQQSLRTLLGVYRSALFRA
ncbi:MAG: hypothetical protein WCK65_10675 [Rhodospirillaceae bacterium]